jgi:hypothetical protein
VDDGPVGVDGSSWDALPGRALEVLAHACSARVGRGGRVARAAEPPAPESVALLAAGVTTLSEAVRHPAVPAADAGDVTVQLRTAAELLAALGEAGRRVACSAGAVGQEPAAEAADAITCVALILRILAELGLRSVPPADAGGRPPR